MRTWKRRAVIGAGLTALVGVGAFAVRLARTRIPIPVSGESASLSVQGEYFAVNLDHVDEVAVRGERILIRGFHLKNWGLGPAFETDPVELTRFLPQQYQGVAADNRWTVLEGEYRERTRRYTFVDLQSKATFALDLPRGSERLHFQVLRAAQSEVVVFGSGDWKVGPPSYYGYVSVLPR